MTTKNRLRHLPQNKLDTILTGLEQEAAALKGAPQFVGGSSVVFFQSDSGSPYDWSGTLTRIVGAPTGNGQAFILVQATAVTMPDTLLQHRRPAVCRLPHEPV